jgi:thiol-disulfide isomerase/thioredoxin
MNKLLCLVALFATSLVCSMTTPSAPHAELPNDWRFVLASPGGELPFLVQFSSDADGLHSTMHNGSEVIPVGETKLEGNQLTLRLTPYDSELRAELSADRTTLKGIWTKSLGGEKRTQLPLTGTANVSDRFPLTPIDDKQRAALDGRWSVQFESDENLSVGTFETLPGGALRGTFETTLGDYRFLAGTFDGSQLRLSCFDGGHAFLFHATLNADGTLTGDFWSRDVWHEDWTATKNPDAKLTDPFGLTTWNSEVSLGDFSFPDLDGKVRALDDPAFAGKARIISLFGTWCPNCNDEARFLSDLDKRYGKRGLSILGLAFELDDDFARSCRQVKRFKTTHSADYPVLIAGAANKAKASAAFTALDRVRAYPTAIFLDRHNQVRAIHTGFSGPATGAAFEHMSDRYHSLIEELLADEAKK